MLKRHPHPRARLLCFPHAGGAASFFQSWAELVPDGVELIAVRYPGREDRLLDPPAGTMDQLAEPLARACSALLDTPLVLFGHSMGAAVAYEVALRMSADPAATPAALFVSGRGGPGHQESTTAAVSDAELIEELALLGGPGAQAFEIPELRDLVLPGIRADYRLLESYQAALPGSRLNMPVVAYYGTGEEDLSEVSVGAWSAVTRSFALRTFDGGHFYLVDQAPALVADLFSRIGV
ncbi:thioesterase II family protein [Kitasatospora sp. NPDC052896]|uniref:thioesterase II family protein n=1 Tax=Kitasatospora sp. NPDC052896 TaxID=3364061 RepID=UPI0037C5792B